MRGKCKNTGWRLFIDWRFDLTMGVVVLVLIQLTLPKQSYKSTGDELYDDYAQLVIKEYNKEYPSDFWLWIQSNVLRRPKGINTVSMSEIAEWQDKYSDDPRYWQLFRDCQPKGRASNREFDESIRNGIYNEASFYYLAWDVDRSSTSLTEDECYDRAIALNPNNAYYYYFKAFYCLYERRIDDSWEALRNGNAAHDCYVSKPFPDGFIIEQYDRSAPNKNKYSAGITHTITAVPNSRTIKDSIKKTVGENGSEVELEYLDDLAWAQLRLMESEEDLPIIYLIHRSLYKMIVCDSADELLTLSPEQAREYAFIKQQIKQIQEIARKVPDMNWQDLRRSSFCELYDAIELEKQCCQELAALHEGYPRYPLSSWVKGEMAGYPVPEDFEPLPKYLPQAE